MRHPMTVELFVDWLKEQDPNEVYNRGNPYDCAICRYLRSIGVEKPIVDCTGWSCAGDRVDHPIDEMIEKIAYGSNRKMSWFPMTYGEALENAYQLGYA